MAKLKVKYKSNPVMTVRRSHFWARKLVYVVLANKLIKYPEGRSRVIYIGRTKKGEGRPASNAASKSLEAFENLHGVKFTEVRILVSQKRQNLETWAKLESALLVLFKHLYGKLPQYNKKLEEFHHIEQVERFFSEKRLRFILREFET